MSKHTPGPWTIGCSMDEMTSLTRGEYVVFPLPEDDEIEANGRLIAAAPDLLHALKWAAEYVSLHTGDGAGWTGVQQGHDRDRFIDDNGFCPERLRAFIETVIVNTEGGE